MGNISVNKTVQTLIAILKGHGIKNIVISPGTTNFMFVSSIQNDDWFHIKSSADERSAAYIACGWAAETGEPVVISCTGATASRNYLPALTEAYYRKLPVLAITSINDSAMPGNNTPQVIDRTQLPLDTVRISVNIGNIHDEASTRKCIVLANKAILELTHHGGGPAHINLMTKMTKEMTSAPLPSPRIIRRYESAGNLPLIDRYKKIAVYVGSHPIFSDELTESIEQFCALYHAPVLCDQTSNYKGSHRFLSAYVASQERLPRDEFTFDLLIDIGEVSGDYYQFPAKSVWRVSLDGELRDRFGKLCAIFEITEKDFFDYYSILENNTEPDDIINDIVTLDHDLRAKTPELPFSNIWIAKNTAGRLPENCVVHFGILNSLRAWNFFEIPASVAAYSNVGGFGIDGDVSTLIGASFADSSKLYFGFVGDLAFFYDMNSIGNRHIGNNLRLLVVNNGKGTEFRNYSHPASSLGDAADLYVAAAGHYGNKSRTLLKHYAEDLGFCYLTASNKEEFLSVIDEFLKPEVGSRPMILEVFTDSELESNALKILRNTIPEGFARTFIKKLIGKKR